MQTDQTGLCLHEYDYDLPEHLVAQEPTPDRGESRLLVVNRQDECLCHSRFERLAEHLPQEALLVANNTKVAPARLLGQRPSGGKAELLLLTPPPLLERKKQVVLHSPNHFQARALVLLKPGKRIRVGDILTFGPHIQAEVVEKGEFGQHEVLLLWEGCLQTCLENIGNIPLPPYIHREVSREDAIRYQTVYANGQQAGSVAAPTAGLHFTSPLRSLLLEKGFGWAEVTLHVGYGTFSPVREENICNHLMHKEFIEISSESAHCIAQARREGRPVVAVGTTSARSLEGTTMENQGTFPHEGWEGWTDIFIYPGYTFQMVQGLITNFHLPKSSLLMLVSALAGRERILNAYAQAIEQQYRFFSYGDAMLIV